MIRTVSVKINAANPSIPLPKFEVEEASAVTVILLNVPKSRGKFAVREISATVTNTDAITSAYNAVKSGDEWIVTIPSDAIGASGVVTGGVAFFGAGTDEHGENVWSWALGHGDLIVRAADGSIKPGEKRVELHYFDAAPEHPSEGDIAPIDGTWSIYTGSAWQALGLREVTWGNITGKPETFTPSAHKHTASEVSGLGAAANMAWGETCRRLAEKYVGVYQRPDFKDFHKGEIFKYDGMYIVAWTDGIDGVGYYEVTDELGNIHAGGANMKVAKITGTCEIMFLDIWVDILASRDLGYNIEDINNSVRELRTGQNTILGVQFVNTRGDVFAYKQDGTFLVYVFGEKKLFACQFMRGSGVQFMYEVAEADYPAVVRLFTHSNAILEATMLSVAGSAIEARPHLKETEDGHVAVVIPE